MKPLQTGHPQDQTKSPVKKGFRFKGVIHIGTCRFGTTCIGHTRYMGDSDIEKVQFTGVIQYTYGKLKSSFDSFFTTLMHGNCHKIKNTNTI